MKAIVRRDYGSPDVLACEEVERPTPGDDEVLIRVRAASVNPLDWRFMRGAPYAVRLMLGRRRPKDVRVGFDAAGTVAAVGRSVTHLKPGDEVFGACRGAFAEYACGSQSGLVAKSEGTTFEEAAAAPIAAVTALQALRDKGRIQPGQRVLINGAAGGVGTFAVQIAKSFGAEVTGVCSTSNVELVRSIGADHAVDYTRDDFTQGGQRYDLMLDAIANRPLSDCRRILTAKGTYVLVGGSGGRWIGPLAYIIRALALAPFVSQRLVGVLADVNKKDLTAVRELMASGQIRSVIDRRYALSDAAEALRYLEAGHARGKVVIIV